MVHCMHNVHPMQRPNLKVKHKMSIIWYGGGYGGVGGAGRVVANVASHTQYHQWMETLYTIQWEEKLFCTKVKLWTATESISLF